MPSSLPLHPSSPSRNCRLLSSLAMDWMHRQTARLHSWCPPSFKRATTSTTSSMSGGCVVVRLPHPRRRQNFSDNQWRDHKTTITANLPTHLHHGYAMLRLTRGMFLLGERGVMVAMGHGLCVCFVCVWRDKNRYVMTFGGDYGYQRWC
jgi:hypothetical protein